MRWSKLWRNFDRYKTDFWKKLKKFLNLTFRLFSILHQFLAKFSDDSERVFWFIYIYILRQDVPQGVRPGGSPSFFTNVLITMIMITPKKYSPINEDLMKLLKEMGYDQMKGKNVKLIDPENTYTINTIMEKVSR